MKRCAGVTLIELVITMSVIGILAAAAAVFLKPAVEAYFGTQVRAELADVADTAARRMVRDLRLALPNSVRTTTAGANSYAEILLTRNGGRYRAVNDNNAGTTEDPLDFAAADNRFDTLGNLPTSGDQLVRALDYVAIHNLGIAGANAYDTGAAKPNIARISAYAAGGGALPNEDRITLAVASQFPLESPGRRFFVVSGPVTFACLPATDAQGNGTGTLERWSGYAISLAQPSALPGGASSAPLARYVSACSIDYTALPLQARGLVQIRLQLGRAGERVTLYYEAHVSNVP